MLKKRVFLCCFMVLTALIPSGCKSDEKPAMPDSAVSVKDSLGRELQIPAQVSNIICSGPGALRYITYMQCQGNVIAVDDMERDLARFEARPYAYANPGYKELPVFGEFRGNDNPELIAALDPRPDLIFKTFSQMGHDPLELQQKTQVPVFVLEYGDLGANRRDFYLSIEQIGRIMNRTERAESIKNFIDDMISDLDSRTRGITDRRTCYIGGIAYRGPHGLQSTEPGYPPFAFINTPNACTGSNDNGPAHMDVSKEKIIEWDPAIIFIDLSTLQSDPRANAIYELSHDEAYRSLQAVKSGSVYGVLPYNWYTQNHGSTLANAWFIGKILYPEQFEDIDPIEKADEIYTFLVGVPVFEKMDDAFGNMVYKKLEL